MPKKFIGSYYRNLDVKGRILLPPVFLEALDFRRDGTLPTFWMTAYYGRIVAYRNENWEYIVEQLSTITFPSQKLSNFKSKVVGLGQEVMPDTQGRVRISQVLMREAALNKQIVLVGLLDKFEIWDQGRFEGLEIEDVSEELLACDIKLAL